MKTIEEILAEEPRIYWDRELKRWRTAWTVEWFDHATKSHIVVPAGFCTDLASVPAPLWPLVAPWGNWNRAAIVHDYLYTHKGVLLDGKKLSRKQADRIFLDISIIDGTNPLTAVAAYYAIRVWPLNWGAFR